MVVVAHGLSCLWNLPRPGIEDYVSLALAGSFFLSFFLFCFESLIHRSRMGRGQESAFLLFIYFWMCWVFVALGGLSLVVAIRAALCGSAPSGCGGFSLQSTGSGCVGFSSCSLWA